MTFTGTTSTRDSCAVKPDPQRVLVLLAALVAGVSFAVAVRFGAHSASHNDASGYVAESALWQSRTLFRPVSLALWATWPHATESASPLGFRPGVISGTEVPVYPPGFPMMIAALSAVVGPSGPYLVAPAMSAAMVFTTFLLGRILAGATAGLIAAILLALSPVTILNTVYPMSDAPAAACWAAAWCVALTGSRASSVTAGLLVALAILVRPNLAPLAVIPFVVVGVMAESTAIPRWRWPNSGLFAVVAGGGVALLAWTQAALYGSPIEPGYTSTDDFFRLSRIGENARVYWRLWGDVFGWVPLIGLAIPVWMAASRKAFGAKASILSWSALAFIVLNVALYLPYLTFDHWPFLRFLLPATIALLVLFGAVSVAAVNAVWERPAFRWAIVLVPIALATVAFRRTDYQQFAMHEWRAHASVPVMGGYLRETLPANAIALSFIHSGAIAYYTHRPVVRLDVIAPPSFDDIVATLERSGLEPTLVLDAALEQPRFGDLFTGSQFAALDWPPRAEFTGVSTIRYFVLADRARYLAGARWPTDVLR